jgi:hypothetical protein
MQLPTSHQELVSRLIRKSAKEHEVPEELLEQVIKLEELRYYSPTMRQPKSRFRELVKEWTARS